MVINNNLSAMNANRNLGINQTAQASSMEKLSSGLRINRAGDDAAGLAISEKMRNQIAGLEQASRNAQDGISLIQTAEGALGETHEMLQRMRELSIQSMNDTYTDEDREKIDLEIQELLTEIDGVSQKTEFNDQLLLAGEGNTAQAYLDTIASAQAQITDIVSANPDAYELTIALKEMEISIANGYSKYTSYDFGDGTVLFDEMTLEQKIEMYDSYDNQAVNATDGYAELSAEDLAAIKALESTISDATAMLANTNDYGYSSYAEFEEALQALVDSQNDMIENIVKNASTASTTATETSYEADLWPLIENEIARFESIKYAASDSVNGISDGDKVTAHIDGWDTMTVMEKLEVMSTHEAYIGFNVTNGTGGYASDADFLATYKPPTTSSITDYNSALDGVSDTYVYADFFNEVGIVETLDDLIAAVKQTDSYELVSIVSDMITDMKEVMEGTIITGTGSNTVVSGTVEDRTFEFHVGANENQKISVDIGAMDTYTLGIKDIDALSKETASAALQMIDDAIETVSTQRALLGAVQNRLEHTIKNVDNTAENLQSAESNIRDTDMASEMMEYTKYNILAQASQSMLAQANQQPQQVLQLLG